MHRHGQRREEDVGSVDPCSAGGLTVLLLECPKVDGHAVPKWAELRLLFVVAHLVVDHKHVFGGGGGGCGRRRRRCVERVHLGTGRRDDEVRPERGAHPQPATCHAKLLHLVDSTEPHALNGTRGKLGQFEERLKRVPELVCLHLALDHDLVQSPMVLSAQSIGLGGAECRVAVRFPRTASPSGSPKLLSREPARHIGQAAREDAGTAIDAGGAAVGCIVSAKDVSRDGQLQIGRNAGRLELEQHRVPQLR
eukprot:scaffold57739_cov78-Phaeocystis_antarctica.AAC.5